MGRVALFFFCGLWVVLVAGCSASRRNVKAAPLAAVASNPLQIPLDDSLRAHPDLVARIQRGPHAYFRLINVLFSREVCRRFAEEDAPYRLFNLHGDAHLEQYAVTEEGRGLTDFDDASTGPAVIDIMHMAVSLRLACKALPFERCADTALSQFFDGYQHALRTPDAIPSEPKVARRARKEGKQSAAEFLARAEKLMHPLPLGKQQHLVRAMVPYRRAVIRSHPKISADFFRIARMGSLTLGIGSARDEKYLLRVAGLTSDAKDDVILEVKEVRDVSGIPCVQSGGLHNLYEFWWLRRELRITPSTCWAISRRVTDNFGFMLGPKAIARSSFTRHFAASRSLQKWHSI